MIIFCELYAILIPIFNFFFNLIHLLIQLLTLNIKNVFSCGYKVFCIFNAELAKLQQYVFQCLYAYTCKISSYSCNYVGVFCKSFQKECHNVLSRYHSDFNIIFLLFLLSVQLTFQTPAQCFSIFERPLYFSGAKGAEYF